MRKFLSILITMLILLGFSANTSNIFAWANGEGSCYSKGNLIGSAGLSFYYFGLIGAFDYGLHDCISTGLAIGYNGTSRYQGDVRDNYFPVAVRAGFHPFNLAAIADKIAIRNLVDIYVGLTVGWAFGFRVVKPGAIYVSNDEEIHHLIFREYIGMRYHFSDKWSLFIEDNADLGVISVGVSRKF